MNQVGLCLQCQTVNIANIEGLAGRSGAANLHCYGTGDQTTPGLIGFVCSCPCRHWVKPDQPRFAEPKKVRKSQLTTRELAALNLACAPLKEAFGHSPYLVGSCEQGDRDYRDVDVRLILPDDEFDATFGGKELVWHIFCWAVAEWLNKVTGLPIDFQAQRQTEANQKYGTEPRNPLGTRARMYAGGGDATKFEGSAND